MTKHFLSLTQRVGLAAVTTVLSYQPIAMQAQAVELRGPSPTNPITLPTAAFPNGMLAANAAAPLQLAQASDRSFVGAAYPASGSYSIVEEGGQAYIELDDSFSTQAAPDLFVLLHTEAVPQSYAPESYLNLGMLQQVTGTQRYAIPAEVDISAFESVVIWCRQFDVTFSYAAL